jgi:hypothetical protein
MAASWTERLHHSTGSDKPKPSRQEVDDVRSGWRPAVRESKTISTAEAIADELAKAPSCRRIVFETGRMAPILFHGLNQLGLPVVCLESRQAYQALKSPATHKTDRNDARGLTHLARTRLPWRRVRSRQRLSAPWARPCGRLRP